MSMTKRTKQAVPGRTVAVAFASMALSVFAILLWGKLKLVTGVPRTAYAVPDQAPPPPPTRGPASQPKSKAPAATTQVPENRPDLHGD